MLLKTRESSVVAVLDLLNDDITACHLNVQVSFLISIIVRTQS